MATECIVVVADDADSRAAFCGAPTELGYAVEQADTGHRGLMRVLAGNQRWCASSSGCPTHDWVRSAAAHPCGMRVRRPLLVAVTARAGEREARRALDAGFDAYVAKPSDVKALRTQGAADGG
jgi:CheY-like chemotaxis protein